MNLLESETLKMTSVTCVACESYQYGATGYRAACLSFFSGGPQAFHMMVIDFNSSKDIPNFQIPACVTNATSPLTPASHIAMPKLGVQGSSNRT